MTDTPIDLPSLESYIPKIRHWNDYYTNLSETSPDERHGQLIAAVAKEFEKMKTDSLTAYEAHILSGARRLSIHHGQKTAPLEFGPDYYVIADGPDAPQYAGKGLKKGPWIDGPRIYVTIGGQNVSGTVSGHAKLTDAAMQRMTQDRVIALRILLQNLQLEDDLP